MFFFELRKCRLHSFWLQNVHWSSKHITDGALMSSTHHCLTELGLAKSRIRAFIIWLPWHYEALQLRRVTNSVAMATKRGRICSNWKGPTWKCRDTLVLYYDRAVGGQVFSNDSGVSVCHDGVIATSLSVLSTLICTYSCKTFSFINGDHYHQFVYPTTQRHDHLTVPLKC